MKRKSIVLVIIMMIALLMNTLTGCSSNNTATSSAISLVLGNHEYFPKINLRAESVYQKIYDAVYSYGDCSIVVVDGNPYVAASYNITKPDANIDNAKRKQISKQNTEQIIADGSNAFAKTSEIDTLSAIVASSALLKSSPAEVKEMLVYDSGFSTTGLLDFSSENLIEVEPYLIVERLSELHALPELNGIRIIWTGLGEVCDEQDKLSSTYKYNLKNIWREVIIAAGGEIEFIDVPLSATPKSEELPSCKTIPIIQDTLELSGNIAKPIKFGEDTIKFLGDQAVYVNAGDAKKALEPIATFLKENATKRILIVGTTASAGKESSCLSLSLNRANTCKKTLIEMGVMECQIETLGLGRKVCFLRVNDLDVNGKLIQSLASQNRAVYIFDLDSEEAKQVIKIS
ncbi:MAG: OmpA family protein [Clostridia bacterium]|nr:OmpA family protein [Clostridia bacterium]